MIVHKIEKYIKTKKKDGFVYPLYDGYSFYNIVPTIFNLFGIKNKRKSLSIDIIKNYIDKNNKIILFLIDGLGYDHYKKFYHEYEFFEKIGLKGTVFPITSIFPSTTAACLTTFATGLMPFEHGLFEWNLYVKEIDQVVQTLPFSLLGKTTQPESLLKEGVSPSILLKQKTKTIFQELRREGIKSYVFSDSNYINSTYSSLVAHGATRISFDNLSDLFIKLKRQVVFEKDPSLFYVYWGNIDRTEHKFGPNSDQHLSELKIFIESLWKDFIKKSKEIANVIILITSDHGQINTNPKNTRYLDKDKKLVEVFAQSKHRKKILPWGSPRDVFLSIKKKEKEKILHYLIGKYSKEGKIMAVEEAIKIGLFGSLNEGKPSKRFLERVGDILILPYDNNTIWYEHVEGEFFEFLGYHGGLSEKEMLIPFGISRLEDLL